MSRSIIYFFITSIVVLLQFCILTAVNCEDEVETRFQRIYSFAKRNPDIARQFFDTHNFKRQAIDVNTNSIGQRSVGQEDSYIKLLEDLKHKLHSNLEFKPASTLNWFKLNNNNLRVRDTSNETVSSPTIGTKTFTIDNDLSKLAMPVAESNCTTFFDPANATWVLEKVLEELELIKVMKQGNSTPEGSPCDIFGSWNSEVIGLRLDLNFTQDNGINVALVQHLPKRATYILDENWRCSGKTLHDFGGPFWITCEKKPKSILASFNGICKKCGDFDTIFGSWNFVHHPKNCQDLHSFIETKNDVFRKETLHLKKFLKEQRIKEHRNDNQAQANHSSLPSTKALLKSLSKFT